MKIISWLVGLILLIQVLTICRITHVNKKLAACNQCPASAFAKATADKQVEAVAHPVAAELPKIVVENSKSTIVDKPKAAVAAPKKKATKASAKVSADKPVKKDDCYLKKIECSLVYAEGELPTPCVEQMCLAAIFNCGDFLLSVYASNNSTGYIDVETNDQTSRLQKVDGVYSDGELEILNDNGAWKVSKGSVCSKK